LTVPPRQAIDLDVTFRISSDTSMRHLLEPYKTALGAHYPTLAYHPDQRPFAQFVDVGQPLVTPENPLGFNGSGRRLDTASGTRRFVNFIVPKLVRANAAGCIFWALGGYNPRGAMYRPDFDDLPPAVEANVPALVNGFKSRGLRVGLCARPSDGVHALDEKTDGTYRLSADNPTDVELSMNRFRHALAMGFDVFYCDSFGVDFNDVKMLRKLRQTVGPDVLLYTEHCCDLTLPLAGRYCEWEKSGGISWTSPTAYEVLRYLCPQSTWLCLSRTNEPVPAAFSKLGLVPLVHNDQTAMLPVAARTALPASRP
jgi:hypothetical protein